MEAARQQLETLMHLEARHDELLLRLDELDRRVEKVLAEWGPAREPGAASFAAVEASRLVDRPPEPQPQGYAEPDPDDAGD